MFDEENNMNTRRVTRRMWVYPSLLHRKTEGECYLINDEEIFYNIDEWIRVRPK